MTMGRRSGIFALLVAASLMLLSCSGKGRVIPRDKMSRIYAELFLIDQRIASGHISRNQVDTTLVYEPVFRKYGYTAQDYRASVDWYMKDPERFARIIRVTARQIEADIKALKKQKAEMDAQKDKDAAMSVFIPDRIYFLTGLGSPDATVVDSLVFYVDSSGGELYFDTRKWLDTAYFGPSVVVRLPDTSSLCASDSLAVASDSLAQASDSVAVSADTAAVRPFRGEKIRPAVPGRGEGAQAPKEFRKVLEADKIKEQIPL